MPETLNPTRLDWDTQINHGEHGDHGEADLYCLSPCSPWSALYQCLRIRFRTFFALMYGLSENRPKAVYPPPPGSLPGQELMMRGPSCTGSTDSPRRPRRGSGGGRNSRRD